MKISPFIVKGARRLGVGLGLFVAGLGLGQNEADPSNPAMEGESFSTEATAIETNAAISPAVDAAPPVTNKAKDPGPAVSDQSKPEDEAAVAEGSEVPEDAVEGEVEVIDLQEASFPEENWDSSKTKQPQDLSGQVSIEEIVEPPGEYHYAAFGRPNPFLPPRISSSAAAASEIPVITNVAPKGEVTIAGTEIPVVSNLQNYPLDKLELKGIWQLQSGQWRAMIMTPDKEGIIIKATDPISAGKVLAIAKDHIMVRQYRLRPDGTREFSDERLTLGESQRTAPQGAVRLNPGKDPEFTTPKAREERLPVPAVTAPKPNDGKVPVAQ